MKGKLRENDVVEIKRLLQKGELNNKQIGELFSVNGQQISRIKTGKRWGNVKIDENGNRIDNQISPENFIVEVEEKEDKKIDIIDDETTQFRKDFIEGYFSKKSKDHYEPTSMMSKRFIGGIWNSKKWLFNNEWDDFISEVMLVTTNAVIEFKPKDINFDWSKINDESSKEHSTINSYINKAIKARLLDYANELNNSYLEQKDNVKEWKKVDVGSVDALIENDGAETAIIDTLSDEHNFFKMKDNYVGSPFLNWFKGNYEDLLTDEQIRFLNVYKYYLPFESSYVEPYSKIKNKPYTENQINHHIRRIRERVENAWQEYQNR